MRLYHSPSMLLPGATGLTAGGGPPGPPLNPNAAISYPRYLFDANGQRAARPPITSAPMVLRAGALLKISTPDPASIARVTLVEAGSVTHSFDMDQRFTDLRMTKSGRTVLAWLPASTDLAPPGNYMVFLIDRKGVPSEATMLRVDPR